MTSAVAQNEGNSRYKIDFLGFKLSNDRGGHPEMFRAPFKNIAQRLRPIPQLTELSSSMLMNIADLAGFQHLRTS